MLLSSFEVLNSNGHEIDDIHEEVKQYESKYKFLSDKTFFHRKKKFSLEAEEKLRTPFDDTEVKRKVLEQMNKANENIEQVKLMDKAVKTSYESHKEETENSDF